MARVWSADIALRCDIEDIVEESQQWLSVVR